MCKKLFPAIIIIIALILAILAMILPQEKLTSIVYISRFFEVMLPILAVGALIKYLFDCKPSDCVVESKSKTFIDNR